MEVMKQKQHQKRGRDMATTSDSPNSQKRTSLKTEVDLDTLEVVASRCRDNITGSLLVDPVVAEDGHTYERRAIKEWFRRRAPATSPLTHEEIGTKLKENYALRAIVEDLATSPGLPRLERAEWYLARGKLMCGSRREKANTSKHLAPDVRGARKAFERAARLLDDTSSSSSSMDNDLSAKRLRDEALICREICDRILDVARLRDTASVAGIDLAWAEGAYEAIFLSKGIRLTVFQKLARGTRVRVHDDRTTVLAAFEAQDDVLGLPDDWEVSLGHDFVVENYDTNDSTYLIVRPEIFDQHEDNSKEGKWWPYSIVTLVG